MTTLFTAASSHRADGFLCRHSAWFFFTLMVSGAAGCSSGDEVPPPTDPSMLRGIVRIYSIAARDLGRPPQNMEELKAVLAPVTNEPSKYLQSTRDGQEFVVVWGLRLEGASADTVVAHERTGVDGKRMVVTADGNVKEVSAEEFAKLNLPKDHKIDT